MRDDFWENHTEEPPGEIEDAAADQDLALPDEDLPQVQHQNDYWRYNEDEVIRVHVRPRHDLYVPHQDECTFSLTDLGDDRKTYINAAEEQLPLDQWRDPRCQQSLHEPWTGTSTFFWRRPPSGLREPQSLPAPLALPSPPAASQQPQRRPTPSATEEPASKRQATTIQQHVLQDTQQHQESFQQQINYDQRSITFNLSPRSGRMPPTPRRRGRSKTPARELPPTSQTPQLPPPATAAPAPDSAPLLSPIAQQPEPQVMTPQTDQRSQVSAAPPQSLAPSTSHHQQSSQPVQAEEPMSAPDILPAKRGSEHISFTSHVWLSKHSNGDVCLEQEAEIFEPRLPFASNHFYKCYLNSDERKLEMGEHAPLGKDDGDASTDDENLTVSNQRQMSRQEAKQLDREIPWRELTKLPRMTYEKYLDATKAEYESWLYWGGIKPVPRAEAQKILKDRKMLRRVLKSRAAYRDKNRGQGEVRAKCRVVLIGCNDPDLFRLTRDAPTPSRLSEYLVLAIATAGYNREVNNDDSRLSDAKSAFLQGEQDPSERDGPIFMWPPKDPLMTETNSFPAELYEVVGNCYGLSNAPHNTV